MSKARGPTSIQWVTGEWPGTENSSVTYIRVRQVQFVLLPHCLMLICSWTNFRKVCRLPNLLRELLLRGIHSTWMTQEYGCTSGSVNFFPDDPRETLLKLGKAASQQKAWCLLHLPATWLSRWPYRCMSTRSHVSLSPGVCAALRWGSRICTPGIEVLILPQASCVPVSWQQILLQPRFPRL